MASRRIIALDSARQVAIDGGRVKAADLNAALREAFRVVERNLGLETTTGQLVITDLRNMPGFNQEVTNGTDSVSAGKIYVKIQDNGIITPYCMDHGAINKVSATGIWRCLACNEGCYEVPHEQ